MSRTITHLSITVEDESANSHLFNMVYHSIMPFLKALRLCVLANNEQNCCGETPEQRLHNIDLPRRYPSLASVQLIVVNWPFSGTPNDGVPQEMMGTIIGSCFLCSCLDMNILTIEAYKCYPGQIIQGQKPDAEWISEGGSLNVISHSEHQNVS
jgi:hypothetical protein